MASLTASRVPSRAASATACGSASARASMIPSSRSNWSLSCFRLAGPFVAVADMSFLRL